MIGKLDRDEGMGLITALAIAFIVFTMSAVWVATSHHELDETSFTRHRTSALNSAEAGARLAMAALAQDGDIGGWIGVDESAGTSWTVPNGTGLRTALQTADYVGQGSGGGLGGACDLVDHNESAAGRTVGQHWARVWAIDASEWRYQIESWGWAPSSTGRQASAQKVSIQVQLRPDGIGFTNALFAEANLSALNRKEIYGDVYTGETMSISNYTRIYPNDAGYPGIGQLRVAGDLLIGSGSNNIFGGPVHVQGVLRDNNVGTAYTDLLVRNDEDADTTTSYGAQSYVRSGTVAGEARFRIGSATPPYTGSISGTVVTNVNDMADLPHLSLPVYTWIAADYDSPIVHPSVAAFDTWLEANRSALQGVHYVPGPVGLDLRGGGMRLAGDFMVVAADSVVLQGSPSVLPAAETPANLIVVQLSPTGRLTTANGVGGSDGTLHHLLFSNGELDVANQTTIYGAVYGHEDVSSNRLEVHFRPPKDHLVNGFDFGIPIDPTSFVAVPQVWRTLAPAEPTPITDYCTMP